MGLRDTSGEFLKKVLEGLSIDPSSKSQSIGIYLFTHRTGYANTRVHELHCQGQGYAVLNQHMLPQ